MGYFTWIDKKIKKMHWYDISLIKLSTASAILLIAALWPPLASLEWYWYGLIFVVVTVPELYKFFH